MKRAAELSFYLTKWKQNFAYDRITMITIDQLKAAMSLKSQYEQADEKTVGTWRNTKAATGVEIYAPINKYNIRPPKTAAVNNDYINEIV